MTAEISIIVLCYVVKVFTYFVVNVEMQCDMVGFYRELGCVPDPSFSFTAGCPRAFICPHDYANPKFCYYRGVQYDVGATIMPTEIKSVCTRSCVCFNDEGVTNFKCATVECPHFANNENSNCIEVYSHLNDCCASGSICGQEALSKLFTCQIHDSTYKQGESFEPLNERKICLCTQQWDGGIQNPQNCRDVNCGLELFYQRHLKQNCAPVFFGQSVGCPTRFQCYQNDVIIRNNYEGNAIAQCRFGLTKVDIGDDIIIPKSCLRCRCRVPPLVICRHSLNCNDI